jgi:hypothetical protein
MNGDQMLHFTRDVTEQAAKVALFAGACKAGNEAAVRKSAGPPQAAGDFFQ